MRICFLLLCSHVPLKYMNKRTITIILLTLIIVFLLAGIIYFLFFFNLRGGAIPPAAPAKQENTAGGEKPLPSAEPAAKQAETVANENAKPATAEEITRYTLAKIASSFAERLGSYSNQSNYGNISDLKIFMTASMRNWADGYVEKAKNNSPYSGIYQGVTTRAISTEVKNFSDSQGRADFIVHTKKSESTGDISNSSVYYEDILITFIKEKGAWLVDNAKWQGKK
jgi:hypothetical protein